MITTITYELNGLRQREASRGPVGLSHSSSLGILLEYINLMGVFKPKLVNSNVSKPEAHKPDVLFRHSCKLKRVGVLY